jgi:hypothetical protein
MTTYRRRRESRLVRGARSGVGTDAGASRGRSEKDDGELRRSGCLREERVEDDDVDRMLESCNRPLDPSLQGGRPSLEFG